MSTDLTTFTHATPTMSSREIAELTGKRHDHVMADIRKMLNELEIQSPEFSGDYTDNSGRRYPCFNLPKRETYILVTGYSIPLRAKVIDRWQELEATQQQQPSVMLLPGQRAAIELKAHLDIASLLGVPLHYAQIEAVKAVKAEVGVDLHPLLTYAPAQDNIPTEVVMLEPTEAARVLGIQSAQAFNLKLASLGWQTKTNGTWEPTKAGEAHCAKHSWGKGPKSGYNLKWNVSAVRRAIS